MIKSELYRVQTESKMSAVQTALAGANLPVKSKYDEKSKTWIFEAGDGVQQQQTEILISVTRLFVQFFGKD